MEHKKIKWFYNKPLSEAELQDIANEIMAGDDLPLDNNFDTDIEESDNDSDTDFDSLFPSTFKNNFKRNGDEKKVNILQDIRLPPNISSEVNDKDNATESSSLYPQTLENKLDGNNDEKQDIVLQDIGFSPTVSSDSVTITTVSLEACTSRKSCEQNTATINRKLRLSKVEVEESAKNEVQEQPARRWKKCSVKTKISDYPEPEGVVEELFDSSETPTSVFIKVLGSIISDITYQSNLYAVQRNIQLDLTEKELLSFIGINFFMAYHQLPNWKHYWNGSPDLGIPLVTNAMSRNRFEKILANIHCNNNLEIPKNNTDKLYKLRI
uniref:Uncharacterized protein LOC114328839 n=1 Tax=Diabrotica virgifera virgifera TaxID=50390 RepID=A0A6P7FFC7_DIAVI